MSNRGKQVRCAIVEEKKDDILGLVSLVSVNQMNQSAELHILLAIKKIKRRVSDHLL